MVVWFWFVVLAILLVLYVWFRSGFRACGCVSDLILCLRAFPGVGLVVLIVLVWHGSVGLVCGFADSDFGGWFLGFSFNGLYWL